MSRGVEGVGEGAAPVEQEAEIGGDDIDGSRGEVRGLEGGAGGLDAGDWKAALVAGMTPTVREAK
jgi:hypothetical protein